MPGRFFTDAERQRLSRFPPQISAEECSRYGTCTPEDLAKIASLRGDHNRLGFALQIGCLRYLGFAPDDLAAAPCAFVAYIAQQIGVAPEVLRSYSQRAHTRTDHLRMALAHLKWSRPSPSDLKKTSRWLVSRALEHDSPSVLFTLAADHLKAQQQVRPGVTVLERLVAATREAAHKEVFRRMKRILTPKVCTALDQLLVLDPDLHLTRLAWLRQKATANTPEGIIATIERIQFVQRLGTATWNLARISGNRIKWLTDIGKRATNQTLQRMHPHRRYPALVAFLRGILEEQTDLAVELVDGCLSHTQSRAEHELDEQRKQNTRATNTHLHYFGIIGSLILDETIPNPDVRAAIFSQIPRDELAAAVDAQTTTARPIDDAALDLFTNRYSYVRQFSPQYLATLRFHAHRETDSIIAALALLGRKRKLLPADAPTTFVPKAWLPYVRPAEGHIARAAYEMCTLVALRDGIKGGRIWVEHSRQFAEPGSFLMPEKQWRKKRQEVCDLTQTSPHGAQQLHMRQADLESLLSHLDTMLPLNLVRIDDGKLVVRPLPAEVQPERLGRAQRLIGESLPLIELSDLVMEVNDDLHFTDVLTHAGGSTSRIPNLPTYLVAAILAQACNYGLKQLAQMSGLSYDTLVWVTEWYLRDETLKAASAMIVNAHYRLPMSHHWGNGALSSSDGRRLPVMGKARNARAISRYFVNTGVTHYTWTSDQLSQYGSKVTVATMRDATYVLDEILDNITDLPIAEHTTDTAGFTELLFCFFDLLGLRFSPRIKNLSAQHLYRMDRAQRYTAIEPLLKGTINQRLILTHYDELLRIAGSLKYGYTSASLLLTKLQSNIDRDPLARAAREYGRLSKSISILRLLVNEEDRRYVHRQLNKGENVNGLRQFILCANEGMVRKHQPEEQLEQALCLTLVTNAAVYWNTVYMSDAVASLRARRVKLEDEDLAHIYPTHFAHINRYGKLAFTQRDPAIPPQRLPLRDALSLPTFTPPVGVPDTPEGYDVLRTEVTAASQEETA